MMRLWLGALLLFGSVASWGRAFVLQTIDGNTTLHMDITPLSCQIREYPSRIIMLDFFGANCVPCIDEMPELVRFQNTFAKTVQIIGIQSASSRDDAAMRHFVRKHNINYPVVNLQEATELIRYVQEQVGWNGVLPF